MAERETNPEKGWEDAGEGLPGRDNDLAGIPGATCLLADAITLFTISGFIFEIPVYIHKLFYLYIIFPPTIDQLKKPNETFKTN